MKSSYWDRTGRLISLMDGIMQAKNMEPPRLPLRGLRCPPRGPFRLGAARRRKKPSDAKHSPRVHPVAGIHRALDRTHHLQCDRRLVLLQLLHLEAAHAMFGGDGAAK